MIMLHEWVVKHKLGLVTFWTCSKCGFMYTSCFENDADWIPNPDLSMTCSELQVYEVLDE